LKDLLTPRTVDLGTGGTWREVMAEGDDGGTESSVAWKALLVCSRKKPSR
jgi:hypothetical protein